jgi:hypothetical protein
MMSKELGSDSSARFRGDAEHPTSWGVSGRALGRCRRGMARARTAAAWGQLPRTRLRRGRSSGAGSRAPPSGSPSRRARGDQVHPWLNEHVTMPGAALMAAIGGSPRGLRFLSADPTRRGFLAALAVSLVCTAFAAARCLRDSIVQLAPVRLPTPPSRRRTWVSPSELAQEQSRGRGSSATSRSR